MSLEKLLPRSTFTGDSRKNTDRLHRELDRCGDGETAAARRHHVGALLAYRGARLVGGNLTAEVAAARFETAQWLRGVLAADGVPARVLVREGRCVIAIAQPAQALAAYGYRVGADGAFWAVEKSTGAAVGYCRGALHAASVITSTGLHIGCPDSSAALTLRGALRLAGIEPQHGREATIVHVPSEELAQALADLGLRATSTEVTWRQLPGELRGSAPVFASANHDRTRHAARRHVQVAQKVAACGLTAEQAEAVQLRLSYPQASLAELAAKAQPPVSKDMFAGRLRRALAHAAA